MTEKRFTFTDGFKIVAIRDNEEIMNSKQVCNKLNELAEENKGFKIDGEFKNKEYSKLLDSFMELKKKYQGIKKENKELKKQLHLMHMSSMFSTVKSFKGDVSERYDYSEETDTLYDTANTYGQYHKILDKKEVCMLLNEYETLLNNGD